MLRAESRTGTAPRCCTTRRRAGPFRTRWLVASDFADLGVLGPAFEALVAHYQAGDVVGAYGSRLEPWRSASDNPINPATRAFLPRGARRSSSKVATTSRSPPTRPPWPSRSPNSSRATAQVDARCRGRAAARRGARSRRRRATPGVRSGARRGRPGLDAQQRGHGIAAHAVAHGEVTGGALEFAVAGGPIRCHITLIGGDHRCSGQFGPAVVGAQAALGT